MLYSVTYKLGPINQMTVKSKWGRQYYEVLINGKRFVDNEGKSGFKSINGAKSSVRSYLKYAYTSSYGYYGRACISDEEFKEMMKKLMGTTPDKLIYIKRIDD